MVSSLLGSLNGIAAVVVVFGLCLLSHEAGHLALAKACGMLVEEFAFGFGPPLLHFRRGETVYRFNLFFFIGGYVRIAGMEPGEGQVARGFHTRPRWQGALVIAAGSVFNLLLAFVIFSAVTYWTGLPDPADQGIYIGKVARNAPAARAGLRAGDEILAVDGANQSLAIGGVTPGSRADRAGLRGALEIDKVGKTAVHTPGELLAALRAARTRVVTVETINYLARDLGDQYLVYKLSLPPELRSARTEAALDALLGLRFLPIYQGSLVGYIGARPNRQVTLTIRRDGQVLEVPVTTMAKFDRDAGRNENGMLTSEIKQMGRIGIVMRSATQPVSLLTSLQIGGVRTYAAALSVPLSIQAMIRRQIEPELAGPVAIMAMSVERAHIGWDAVLNWAGMISCILAIMNLLPIPPFDGFRLVLSAYEAAIRRRISARAETVIAIIGIVFVLGMFVALTYKDLANLILRKTV